MATISPVAVGLAGLVFLVVGEMPRRAQAQGKPWMRDPEAHPRWHIRDTYREIGIALLTGAVGRSSSSPRRHVRRSASCGLRLSRAPAS